MANNQNEEIEIPRKSNKGLIVVIVILVNLMIVAVVWFLVMGKQGDGNRGGNSTEQRTARLQGGRSGGGPIMEMEGFVVNLSNSRDFKYLKATIAVQVIGEQDVEPFEKQRSKVRNEVLLQLSSIEIDALRTIDGKRQLEQTLAEQINDRLDMERISKVYFTEFVTQ